MGCEELPAKLSFAVVSGHRELDCMVTEREPIDGSNLAETNRLATVEGGASKYLPVGQRRSLQTLTPELRRTGSGVIDPQFPHHANLHLTHWRHNLW